MEPWQEYELQVLRHHIEKHGHEAWHWSNVPEDHLYDAGPKVRVESEKNLARWEIMIRAAKNGTGIYKLTKEREEILSKTEGWVWNTDNFQQKYQEFIEFIDKNKRHPSSSSNDKNEVKLKEWFTRFNGKYKKGELSEDKVKIIESDVRFKQPNLTFEEYYNAWNDFCEKNQKQPSRNSDDFEEQKLASWETVIRSIINEKLKRNSMTEDQKNKIIQNKWWRRTTDNFWINFNNWNEFVLKNRRKPNQSKEEIVLYRWSAHLKRQIAKGKIYTQDKLDALNNNPYWN